jgi:hypothetical protein
MTEQEAVKLSAELLIQMKRIIKKIIREEVFAEREACAKLCEYLGNAEANMNKTWRDGCQSCANGIRVRKQK